MSLGSVSARGEKQTEFDILHTQMQSETAANAFSMRSMIRYEI